MSILDVTNLKTVFETEAGTVKAVNDVSLSVSRGETVGIVGESGSGKSVTGLSIMDLVESPGQIVDGKIHFDGKRLSPDPEVDPAGLRGSDIAMVFQHPMQNFNPVFRVGMQIAEVVRAHDVVESEEFTWREKTMIGNFFSRPSTKKNFPKSWERAVELMENVGITEPEKRADEFPHQFSGGMLQRAHIAQKLAGEPKFLIADEPTTALDVTIQRQILDLLSTIQEQRDMGVLLITHNLGVVREVCDRVYVMYAGKVVEEGTVEEIFDEPSHPYTEGLLQSIPGEGDSEEIDPIEGQIPNLVDMPEKCYFEPRCEYAHEACRQEVPPLYDVPESSQLARCVLHDEDNPRASDFAFVDDCDESEQKSIVEEGER